MLTILGEIYCNTVFAADIYGGHLLGVKSVSGLAFFDWESTDLIRRIEIQPKSVSFLTQITDVALFLNAHTYINVSRNQYTLF